MVILALVFNPNLTADSRAENKSFPSRFTGYYTRFSNKILKFGGSFANYVTLKGEVEEFCNAP